MSAFSLVCCAHCHAPALTSCHRSPRHLARRLFSGELLCGCFRARVVDANCCGGRRKTSEQTTGAFLCAVTCAAIANLGLSTVCLPSAMTGAHLFFRLRFRSVRTRARRLKKMLSAGY